MAGQLEQAQIPEGIPHVETGKPGFIPLGYRDLAGAAHHMAVGEEALRGNQHPGTKFFSAVVTDDVNFQYPVSPLRQAGSGRCASTNQHKQQRGGEKKDEGALQHEYCSMNFYAALANACD